jgi:hypothetical protein
MEMRRGCTGQAGNERKGRGYVAGGEKKEEKIIIIIRNRCTWVVGKKKKKWNGNRGRE